MSNLQRQAFINNGGAYTGVVTVAEQYNRGIKLPVKSNKMSMFDTLMVWLDRKGIL